MSVFLDMQDSKINEIMNKIKQFNLQSHGLMLHAWHGTVAVERYDQFFRGQTFQILFRAFIRC